MDPSEYDLAPCPICGAVPCDLMWDYFEGEYFPIKMVRCTTNGHEFTFEQFEHLHYMRVPGYQPTYCE